MNVIIFLIDALRYDRVNEDFSGKLTPNINKLASEGVSFTSAYSVSNATDVAVTSLQTGKHPLSHGILNHGTRVTEPEKKTIEQIINLAETLGNNGYHTAKFGRPLGRWHRNGFDIYPDFSDNKSTTRFIQKLRSSILTKFGYALQQLDPDLYRFAHSKYSKFSYKLQESVMAQTQNRAGSKSDNTVSNFIDFTLQNDPVYSYVHLMDTHTLYSCDFNKVLDLLQSGRYRPDAPLGQINGHTKQFDVWLQYNSPDVFEQYYYPGNRPSTAITNATYDAAVVSADIRIGKMLNALKNAGIYDESLIILLSDHGESLSEHGIYYDHHGLYEVSVKIPLLIKPPHSKNLGIEVDKLVQIIDVAPTVCDYANIEMDTQGLNLRPYIEGKPGPTRDELLIEESHTQRRRCLVEKEYKLIYDLNSGEICRYCGIRHAPEFELYELGSDPLELFNLSSEKLQIVRDLKAKAEILAESYISKRPSPKDSARRVYNDEDVVAEKLRQLGYK